jgi:murein DD-endopeptidase MepM/ murein hydrolase activator NlpD
MVVFLTCLVAIPALGASAQIADTFGYPIGTGARYTENITDCQYEWGDSDGYFNVQDFGCPYTTTVINGTPYARYHLGEDWNGDAGGDRDQGLPIIAIANGEVMVATPCGGEWGNVVVIRHTRQDGSQLESVYAHLDTIQVAKGGIGKGVQIGTMGNACDTYPCLHNPHHHVHLHFEIIHSDLIFAA